MEKEDHHSFPSQTILLLPNLSMRQVGVSVCFLLRKVCEDERAFLGRQLVLLLPGLLQELLPHDGEHRAQQRPSEDLRGLVPRQAVAELRHVAVAEPPAAQERLGSKTASKCKKNKHTNRTRTWCSWLCIQLRHRWGPSGAAGRASPAASS